MNEIGRKGGQATRQRHGVEFYESIGQKGGKVVKEKYGADFYEEIGHKGGQKSQKTHCRSEKAARQCGAWGRTRSPKKGL